MHLQAADGFNHCWQAETHCFVPELDVRDSALTHQLVHHPCGWQVQALSQLLLGEQFCIADGLLICRRHGPVLT